MNDSVENLPEKSAAENIETVEASVEMYRMLMFRVYQKSVCEVWEKFAEHRCEPILIKGFAAALNYPEPYQRPLGDIDLAINPKHYERALKLQKDLNLGIADLHAGLRQFDTLGWENIRANARLVKCGEKKIRVLRPEDHLRVLAIHWLNDGGINREKLRDILYAVRNRPADFDWERCLGVLNGKRRRWVVCAIGLAHRYLGLEIADTPVAEEALNLPGWLTRTLEREWNGSVEFKYLQNCLGSPEEFFRQLKKRLPPNPIQATINMEGDFDAKTRVFYQIGDVFGRLKPSIERVSKNFLENRRSKKN